MCLGAGAEEPQLSVGSAEDYQMSLLGSGGSEEEAAGVAASSGKGQSCQRAPPRLRMPIRRLRERSSIGALWLLLCHAGR